MQWLIDIIIEVIMLRFSGIIVIWSGAIVDIPTGWLLCDGNNGTPDLSARFIIGSTGGLPPGAIGGSSAHFHPFITDGHNHQLAPGKGIQAGEEYSRYTTEKTDTGNTNAVDSLPPYYALAYIMKS